MNDKVIVLLSTYNGGMQDYLKQQLDSIEMQKNVEVEIHIRDDGSKDNTVDILRKYTEDQSNIVLNISDNLGAARSFLNLCMNCDDPAAYYAFSDQDDVWDEDKLSTAINQIKKVEMDNPGLPVLYYSNLRIADEELKFLRPLYTTRIPVPKTRCASVAEVYGSGNTFVFNYSLLKIINSQKPSNISMHDSWVFLIASFLGKTIFDPGMHLSYRQHGHNVSGAKSKKKGILHYVKRARQLASRTGEARYNNCVTFYKLYGDLLQEKDRKKLEKIITYKSSLMNKILLITDPDLQGSSVVRGIFNRYLMLINRW